MRVSRLCVLVNWDMASSNDHYDQNPPAYGIFSPSPLGASGGVVASMRLFLRFVCAFFLFLFEKNQKKGTGTFAGKKSLRFFGDNCSEEFAGVNRWDAEC